jgi:hypothetical protein
MPDLVLPDLVLLNRAPLWRRCWTLGLSAFAAVMPHPDVGVRLVETFGAAGLPAPAVSCDVSVDGSPDSPIIPWVVLTLRSIMPYLERTGAVTAAELGLDTLEDRLRAEAAALRSQLVHTPQSSGWVRKPGPAGAGGTGGQGASPDH